MKNLNFCRKQLPILVVFALFIGFLACGNHNGIGPEPEPEPEPEPTEPTKPDHTKGDLVIPLPGGVKIAFIWIEPGTFMMGTPDSVKGSAKPQHQATLTKGYYLGKYEVTQQQWFEVMGTKPWEGKVDSIGPEYPACNISWSTADAFLSKMNTLQTTYRFRFPTEAEWEYACRAGTTTSWSFGNNENQLQNYAWYNQNSVYQPQPVGMKLPNPWGLYDMHGNVREYTSDWLGDYSVEPQTDPTGPSLPPLSPVSHAGGRLYVKVNRGGSHAVAGSATQSAVRSFAESFPLSDAGFRALVEIVQ